MNLSLKRHAITLAAAILMSAVAPTIFAQVRIATVDLQRALNETSDGRRAKARLKALFNKRQVSLDKRQAELKKMKEDIENKRDVLSREALAAQLEQYQKQFVELQSTYYEYQRELATKEAQLTQSILERMQGILREIGQTENYTMIVERNEGGVVWVPSHLDLTDQVIQRYNSSSGGGESKNKGKGR